MKKILVMVMVMFLAVIANAKSFKTSNNANSTISIGYDSTKSNSMLGSGLSGGVRELCVLNDTSSLVALNVTQKTEDTALPIPDQDDIYIPPAGDPKQKHCRQVRTMGRIYLRSATGSSITSGDVYVDID